MSQGPRISKILKVLKVMIMLEVSEAVVHRSGRGGATQRVGKRVRAPLDPAGVAGAAGVPPSPAGAAGSVGANLGPDGASGAAGAVGLAAASAADARHQFRDLAAICRGSHRHRPCRGTRGFWRRRTRRKRRFPRLGTRNRLRCCRRAGVAATVPHLLNPERGCGRSPPTSPPPSEVACALLGGTLRRCCGHPLWLRIRAMRLRPLSTRAETCCGVYRVSAHGRELLR